MNAKLLKIAVIFNLLTWGAGLSTGVLVLLGPQNSMA
jgi:hypothetical protein